MKNIHLIFILVLSFSATTVKSATVFVTDELNYLNLFTRHGFSPSSVQGQQVASQLFIPQDLILNEIVWSGSANLGLDDLDFTIRFFDNNSDNLPDDTPFLEKNVTASASPDVYVDESNSTGAYIFASFDEIFINEGNYWVSILDNSNARFEWSVSTRDSFSENRGVLRSGENGEWIIPDDDLSPNGFSNGRSLLVFGSDDLNPVPLPASAWLFLSGLAGLFGVRRANQNKKR